MNLLLLLPDDRCPDGRFVVGGRRAEHLRSVLDVAPGRSLRCGLLEGPRGEGTVVEVGETVVVEVAFEAEPPPRPAVSLVLAVPRPRSLKKLLPEVTALGVDRIVLIRSWRVAKPYLTAAVLEPDAIRALLIEGLEQARCTRLPDFRLESLFRPYVEDRIAAEFADHRRVVLHPGAPDTALRAEAADDRPTVIAIGPEGGWVPFELDALGAAGFELAGMGSRVLRVETACVGALTLLHAARRAR